MATKTKKSCYIVAARESAGDEKPSRCSSRCRRARPRQRNARNFAISLPRRRVSAIKNLRGAVLVAAASGPGNETQEILLYRCRPGECRRRKTFAAQISWPPRQAPATKRKKFCCIVAARESGGDEKPPRRSSRCRRVRPRQRDTRNFVVSSPPGVVSATKPKKSCNIVAGRESVGDEKPSRRSFRCRRARPRQRNARNLVISLPRGIVAATKNLRGADFVAAAPGPGNETQEILLYRCRAGLCRRRKLRNLVVSLPRRIVVATRRKKSCCILAVPGLGHGTVPGPVE